jgi:hypothetical protein
MNKTNTPDTPLKRPLIVSLICIIGIVFSVFLLIFAILKSLNLNITALAGVRSIATFSFNINASNDSILSIPAFIFGTGFLTSYILMLNSECKLTRDLGRFICLIVSIIAILLALLLWPTLLITKSSFDLKTTVTLYLIAVAVMIAMNACLFKKSIKYYWK